MSRHSDDRPTGDTAAGMSEDIGEAVNAAVGRALDRAGRSVSDAAEAAGSAPDVVSAALAGTAAELRRKARELTDATEIRALAHPVRVALLEALRVEGTLTATEAADLIDETPANCSFHLRTLAKYGFVEEAQGGVGRQRPWRRVDRAVSYRLDHDDPATAMAAQELSRQHHSRLMEQMQAWDQNWREYPQAWRDASFISDSVQFLTPAELTELSAEFHALIDRYADRIEHAERRPDDALPVSLGLWGNPLPRRSSDTT